MRGTSISQRIILSTILIVLITIVIGGLPALWTIWRQLENQVLIRIQDNQAATLALYDAERDRMETMARLIADNQTLCTFMRQGDLPGLANYLEELSLGTSVDTLLVITPDHQKVGFETIELPQPNELFIKPDQSFTDFIVLNNPPQLLVLSASEVQLADECESEGVAWLMAARVLNDDYMQTLTQETGMDHSLIIDQKRVASSLSNAPEVALNPNAALDVLRTGTSCCTSGTSNGEIYYLGLAPLRNNSGEIIALSEVALSGGEIRSGALRTTEMLFGVGIVLAMGGSILAIMLTRRITRPLTDLAEAQKRMGEGDLETPIEISSNLTEINQLASQIDNARSRLEHAQRAAKSERERIEHLLGAINDGVIVLDDEDHVTFFNSHAETIFGLRTSDVMGAHYSKVFRSASSESINIPDMIKPRVGTLPVQHITVIGADERPVTLAVSISWLTDNSSGNLSRERVLVVRDISEEEAINKLRSNFLANVSHEFRTPLSAVIATTEVLIEESPRITSNEILKLANSIRLGTLQLQTMVDNLLESATIEAGGFQVYCRPTHLKGIIENACETMAPLLNRRNQRLESDIQSHLPSIWADPERLTQVFINLLANASKFGPMGMEITISAYKNHDNITVAVLDSGPGLPAGRFSDLFERFVTGGKPHQAQYGAGLGLSVVKAIVEAHGGQVGAENRVNGGAKVWFILPINPQKDCK
jgi:signal transduction histidine kinase